MFRPAALRRIILPHYQYKQFASSLSMCARISSLQPNSLCKKHAELRRRPSRHDRLSRALSSLSSTEIKKIENFTEVDTLLNHYTENIDVFAKDASSTAQVLLRLTDIQYSNTARIYPWLQPLNMVAKLQLDLMTLQDEFSEHYRLHPAYNTLVEKISENCDALDNYDLVRSVEALVLLSEDFTQTKCHRLLEEITRRQGGFDMQCMAIYSGCTRHLTKGTFFSSLRPMINRYLELLPSIEQDLTPDGLCAFADMLRNLHRLLSEGQQERSARLLLHLSQRCFQEPTHPEVLNSVSYVARRLYIANTAEQTAARTDEVAMDIMKCVKTAAVAVLDKYDARHIAEITSSLKLTGQYTTDISDLFLERSLELLSPDLSLAEVVNLFYSLPASASSETKRRFESVLYPKLTSVDCITLTNLAESFLQVKLTNHDIILRLQQLVMVNTEGLVTAVSRLFFILKFLQSVPRLEEQTERILSNNLIAYMKKYQVVIPYHSPTVANFCLKCTNGRVTDFLMKELLKSIPHWRINSLRNTLTNLSENRAIYQPHLQTLVTEIQHQIYLQIVERPSVIKNARQLTSFVHLMALHAYYRDHTLTDKLMQLYLKFADDMNLANLTHVTKIFRILRYHSPEVLDMLARTLTAEPDLYPLESWVMVLTTCATVGHTPMNFSDELLPGILGKLNEAGDRDEEGSGDDSADNWETSVLVQELRVMRALTFLHCFPEDRLAQIFSLDFIEKVDDFLSIYPEGQREVEDLMMVLNRIVVLECPQLDVPWFHEVYCQKHLSKDESLGNYKHEMLRESIHGCLQEAVGGDQFINTCGFTPYYHVIDFECLLDDANKPVSFCAVDEKSIKNYQRVAILPYTDKDYCYNSQRLLNHQTVKLRHLQILGYKVIQVPYQTWYSMGLAEHESKVNMLRDVIFGHV